MKELARKGSGSRANDDHHHCLTSGHGLWRKGVILLVSEMVCVSALAIISINSKSNNVCQYHNMANREHKAGLPKNQIGAFSFTHTEPNGSGRIVYSVRAANLSAENGKLGIFKTGLYKVIKITDLELAYCQYTSDTNNSPEKSSNRRDFETSSSELPVLRAFAGNNITAVKNENRGIKNLIGILGDMTRPVADWRINLDISNTTELLINNFDYKVFHDDSLYFELSSRKATVSHKQTGLLLQGLATLRTADGSVLESDCMTWDVSKGWFIVKGTYVLNSKSAKMTGKDICVDAQMKNINDKREKLL